jgi:hypothetical protein
MHGARRAVDGTARLQIPLGEGLWLKVLGENTIAIVKQVLVSLVEPDSLAQLLKRPGRTRMGGDVAMLRSRVGGS